MSRDLDFRKIDVPDMLEQLGVRNITPEGDEVKFSCPFPGHENGDEKPSAYMNTDSTAWFCHGCKRRGNAVSFTANIEDLTIFQAQRFLREAYDSTFREPRGGDFAKEWDDFFKEKEKEPESERVTAPEHFLQATLIDWCEAFKLIRKGEDYEQHPLWYPFSRGFSPFTLEEWEVGFDDISSRITLPVRYSDGVLAGFKARTVDPEFKPKYLNLGDRSGKPEKYGFKNYNVGEVVFGLNKAEGTELIVCEGEFDVLALHQAGYRNAVAIGGSHLTQTQKEELVRCADSFVLFFDDDAAGNEASYAVSQALEPHGSVKIVDDHEGDPASMTISEIDDCVKSAVSSLVVTMQL